MMMMMMMMMMIQMVAQKEKVKARFAGPSGPPCRCCIIAVVMAKAMLFVVATAGLSEGKRRLVERSRSALHGKVFAIQPAPGAGSPKFQDLEFTNGC